MKLYLGIDIGSVTVSLALVNELGQIVKTAYRPHQGAIRETLLSLMAPLDLPALAGIAATPAGAGNWCRVPCYDSQVAMVTAAKHFHPDLGGILFIGAENFGLITFSATGEYERFRSNTSCAAGTGSFLEQQAKRLKLGSVEVLSQEAFCNQNPPPSVATRCAVFAKTDLIHAMQQGYSLGQISDGLCCGTAKNIVDTLAPRKINRPLLLAGGVARNQAVVRHLRELLGVELIVTDYSHLLGAIGAALLSREEEAPPDYRERQARDFLGDDKKEKIYSHPPLQPPRSAYPDFDAVKSYTCQKLSDHPPVEVTVYEEAASSLSGYLGLDIGSTSTKAVLVSSEKKEVLAGFYTYTSGKPLLATQAVLSAIEDFQGKRKQSWEIKGVGTTGSGRKFIGSILNADAVIDEITTHARAAYELNPGVNTIIEIGGQDSKFTTMKDGMVTFSVMNNVCAAGTGSFLEEQAARLGVSLADYARLALGARAPVSSNRCTVFMERDINSFLREGYGIEEILATVLHAVTENYLDKVADAALIGDCICFQGATARNPALIAAFESRLQKTIHVSPFCHLTGALGSALIMDDNRVNKSSFRGLALWREMIPVTIETCELCHNHCKISKITVRDETFASGFLCGRSYDKSQYARPQRQQFSLLKERQRLFQMAPPNGQQSRKLRLGIPNALYLAEEMPLWKHFFALLGVETITGEKLRDTLTLGKKVAPAQFCAPLTDFLGQAVALAKKCDYLFLPVYLQAGESQEDGYRYYCYNTQFVISLVKQLPEINGVKTISPLIDHHSWQSRIELFSLLKPILNAGYWEIYSAYQEALDFFNDRRAALTNIFHREGDKLPEVAVVLMGRPYTVLAENRNKGIPEMLTQLGIPVFFQDMLPLEGMDNEEIKPLLQRFHWSYAAKILQAALFVARTPGLYPVFITSFQCSPDSFALEYFKRLLDSYGKPYLILELDLHDSPVGYETRVEAAVRAFRNHHGKPPEARRPLAPIRVPTRNTASLREKSLLFPCFDPLTAKLLEAVLIREGIDARVVELTEKTRERGLRTNRGQCIPVNLIAQSYIDYIQEHHLDPARTMVWTFESTRVACNIRLYPQMIRTLLDNASPELASVEIYIGNLSMIDISLAASVEAYFAYLFGGILRRLGCRRRPYEKERGRTDQVLSESLGILYRCLLEGRAKDDEWARVLTLFRNIPAAGGSKPKVAIFGDLYARDNDVFNQGLIHCIEEYGGEVITTPLNEFAKLVASPYIRRWFLEGEVMSALYAKTMLTLVSQLEKTYYRMLAEDLTWPVAGGDVDFQEIYDTFHIRPEHCGESADNLIKIASLARHYPDLALFVQTNPVFCSAGLITEAMAGKIESCTGIPVITLTYDGTTARINERIRPYIKFPRKKGLPQGEPAVPDEGGT